MFTRLRRQKGSVEMMEALRATIQRLEQKAQEHETLRNSWEGYAIMLRFVEAVLQRLPTPHDLEAGSIDARFTIELEHLAQMVVDLFPTDSFEELATFLAPMNAKEPPVMT